MVMTRVSSLNKPAYDQIGPVMSALNVRKLAEVRNVLAGKDVKIHNLRAARTVVVEYVADTELIKASVRLDNRLIHCDFCAIGCTIAWCHHIQYVIANGQDHCLFGLYSVDEVLDILIPVIPSEGVFVPARLKTNEDHDDFVDLYLTLVNALTGEDDELHLGTLVAGSFGALEMRSMADDFLNGHMANSQYFNTEILPEVADSSVSEFAHRFYAATGVPLSTWRNNQTRAGDAPAF